MRKSLFALASSALIGFHALSAGCGDSDTDTADDDTTEKDAGEDSDANADADADTDTDTGTDTDTDIDTDTDTGTASSPFPTPDEDHFGWKDPRCWNGCHSENPPYHADGNLPYNCVACHGNNGAIDRPADHDTSGCDAQDCHDEIHGTVGFPVPESCDICHPG